MALVVLLALCAGAVPAGAATGDISTIAGSGLATFGGDGGLATSAGMRAPGSVATAADGTLYIADFDDNRVRRVSPGGVISTFAGVGNPGSQGDDGPATSARLRSPAGLAIDATGAVYIADYGNHVVRKVSPSGIITRFAGTGTAGYSGNGGQARYAQLSGPIGLDFDPAGNLYIAEMGNHRVRKVTPAGVISTVAGNGATTSSGDGGSATAAGIPYPIGLAVDSSGTLYVSEFYAHRVRKVTTGGAISTIAGTGVAGYSGNGGAATSATLNQPVGLDLDPSGNLLIADFANHVVRKVTPAGAISTIAGTGQTAGYAGDGGQALAAKLYNPAGVTVDPAGHYYVADRSNHVVRRVEGLGTTDAPTLTATSPPSPSNATTVAITGTAPAGATVQLYTTPTCTGTVAATGTAAQLTSPGLSATVPSNATTTFYATATDTGGNVSGCSASSIAYVQDASPPSAPSVTASPASPGRGSSPSWSFSGEAGATFECRLERGGTAVWDWTGCSAPKAYDLAFQVDGTYTFSVRATDAAGNTGAAAISTYVLDRTAPATPSITASPASPGNGSAPSWSFSGEAGASFECRLDHGGTTVSDWTSCSAPHAYDLTFQADGTYTFAVRATDAAGNTGIPATSAYVLDRSAAGAPSIIASPASPGNGALPSWSFSGEAGASFECRLDRGATTVSGWAGCSGTRAYDLAAEPDGSYTFSVRATDGAGNTGSSATSVSLLDRTAPAAPAITASPSSPSNDTGPSWSFSGEAGATFECRVERGLAIVADWASCASPSSFDLSAQPDGHYTVSIRAVDPAGNRSVATLTGYDLDRAPPAAPSITAAPTSPGRDTAPSWSFSGEPAATFECRLDRGATVVSDWTTCAPGETYDLSSEPDGTYTLSVRARDAAGNTGPDATSGYELDTAAPAAPSITSAPPAEASDDAPAWWFSGEAGASFECRLERDGAVVEDWSACTSPKAYDLRTELEGDYTFLVRATDAAGNPGPAQSSGYTLDRVGPAAPAIDAAPASLSRDDTPAWSFSGEAGATFECRIERGLVVVADWAACASPRSHDLAAEPDGVYTLSVVAVDAAANRSVASQSSYVLDRSGPAAPTFDAVPPSPSPDTAPSWSFAGEPGASFECRLDRGASVVSGWSPCASGASVDLGGQPDGTYTFSVRALDEAGNTGVPATSDYELDATAPASPSITAGPPHEGRDESPSWSFSGEPDVTLECRLRRGSTIVSDWSACAGARSYDLAAEPDETYTFAVRAIDAAGNASSPATDAYVLDRTAPAAPSIDAGPPSPGRDTTPEWSFSGESGATFECRLARGLDVVADWAPCVGPSAYDLAGEPDGTYTFSVRATDPAGNTGAVASAGYEFDTAPPAPPSIVAGPRALGADDTPTWQLAGEAGSSLECLIRRGATVIEDWAACGTSHTVDLAAEPDGDYTFAARALDSAGNASPATEAAYRLDRLVPAAPAIDSSPPPAGSDPRPSWSFSGSPDETFECRLERGSTVLSGWSPCSSPHTADLTAEPDGTYSLSVLARDGAGNAGPPSTSDYQLDRTAPAAPTIGATPGPSGASLTPSWSFSGEAGAAFSCRLTQGSAVVSDWAACTSPHSYDLAGRPDAIYAFSVMATDAVGNAGPASTSNYELDTPDPATPVINATPGAIGRDRSPAWAFGGEIGATFECRMAAVLEWAPCTSPWTADLAGRPDAVYAFAVRAIDARGNRGPAAGGDYELDTTPPAPPVLGAGPGPVGSLRWPAWTVSTEAGAVLECRLDGATTPVYEWAACASSLTYDLTGAPDAAYTASARAIDRAGNAGAVGTVGYTLDTRAPEAPRFSARPRSPGRDRTPTWELAGEPGARYECRVEAGDDPIADWAPCTGPFRADLTERPDGRYAVVVRATDAAGNTGPARRGEYELLTLAPAAPTGVRGPDSPGTVVTPAWSFDEVDGLAYECRLERGSTTVSEWARCQSPRRYDLTAYQPDEYTFSVRAMDAAGNVGDISSRRYRLLAAPAGGGGGGAAPPPSPQPDPPTGDPDAAAPDAAGVAGRRKRANPPGRSRADRSATPPTRRSTDAPAERVTRRDGPGERGTERERRGVPLVRDVRKAAAAVARIVTQHPDKSVFPGALVLIVVGFVSIQNRMDRNDPKLALAPVFAEADLEFLPPPEPETP